MSRVRGSRVSRPSAFLYAKIATIVVYLASATGDNPCRVAPINASVHPFGAGRQRDKSIVNSARNRFRRVITYVTNERSDTTPHEVAGNKRR